MKHKNANKPKKDKKVKKTWNWSVVKKLGKPDPNKPDQNERMYAHQVLEARELFLKTFNVLCQEQLRELRNEVYRPFLLEVWGVFDRSNIEDSFFSFAELADQGTIFTTWRWLEHVEGQNLSSNSINRYVALRDAILKWTEKYHLSRRCFSDLNTLEDTGIVGLSAEWFLDRIVRALNVWYLLNSESTQIQLNEDISEGKPQLTVFTKDEYPRGSELLRAFTYPPSEKYDIRNDGQGGLYFYKDGHKWVSYELDFPRYTSDWFDRKDEYLLEVQGYMAAVELRMPNHYYAPKTTRVLDLHVEWLIKWHVQQMSLEKLLEEYKKINRDSTMKAGIGNARKFIGLTCERRRQRKDA